MRSGSCSRQELPPPRSSRAMRRVLLTTPLLIVFALILLSAIALASPPDPTWAAGIFDGADGDDIVSLVYETFAASLATPSHLGPLPCLLEISLDRIARNAAGGRFTRSPRSPPVLRSPEFAYVFTSLPPSPLDPEAPVTLASITTVWPCPSAVSWRAASRNSPPRKWSIAENAAFSSKAILEVPRRSFH